MGPSPAFSLGFDRVHDGDLRAWQAQVRARLLSLIHYPRIPGEGTFEVVDRCERQVDGVLQVRAMVRPPPWAPQPVYELTPLDRRLNGATLVAFHGHGTDPFTGIYTYVRELARRGYRVVMPILFGKMERETKGLGSDSRAVCASWSIDADVLGTTLLGARLFDGVLAYRYALSLPGVDPARVGCVGLSMGGELALYLAAIEPGIAACVSAGFLSTFGSLLLDMHNCQCYSIRDWPRYFDMPDIVGCIAPRPLHVLKGEVDPCFDAADVARAFARVRRIYDAFGAPGRATYLTYPGGHCLHVDLADAFLSAHLS